jgi:two-component system cell cycle response regulator
MDIVDDFNGREILVVDDDQDSVSFLRQTLEFEGYQVDTAFSGEEAVAKLKNKQPDLVLLDINMPGISGLDTLAFLRQQGPYVSVIFVSANSSRDSVVRGLNAGADDYVRKPFEIEELLSRIRAKLRIKDLHDRLTAANERLRELADTDDLTGLYNMRSFYQRLETELQRGRRFKRPVAVAMMDMDHFKSVNDDHDHLFGSYVISEVGKIIRKNIRQVDFAARYGGDEFIIVLTETNLHGAKQFTERLRKVIEKRLFESGDDRIKLTVSIGFSVSDPVQTMDGRAIVRKADHCLYLAKEAGRNCVRFFDFSELPDEDKILSHPEKQRKQSS